MKDKYKAAYDGMGDTQAAMDRVWQRLRAEAGELGTDLEAGPKGSGANTVPLSRFRRTLPIAAVIGTLLVAAVYAIGFFGIHRQLQTTDRGAAGDPVSGFQALAEPGDGEDSPIELPETPIIIDVPEPDETGALSDEPDTFVELPPEEALMEQILSEKQRLEEELIAIAEREGLLTTDTSTTAVEGLEIRYFYESNHHESNHHDAAHHQTDSSVVLGDDQMEQGAMSPTMLVGETLHLTAVEYSAGAAEGLEFDWTSSDESAIKLTPTGDGGCDIECIGVHHGGVVITVSAGGQESSCRLYTHYPA